MDKKFLPVMGLMAFVLLGQRSVSELNAKAYSLVGQTPTVAEIEKDYENFNDLNAKGSPSVRQPPTMAEIEKAYKNCLDHECGDFAEWSIEAAEVCSEGGEECCTQARKLLEVIQGAHVGKPIYDNYVPHSFRGYDKQGDSQ